MDKQQIYSVCIRLNYVEEILGSKMNLQTYGTFKT